MLRKLAALLVSLVPLLVWAKGAESHSDSIATVGRVVFPISCAKQAQARVEHGLAMMHSFLFDDAEAEFQAAIEVDRRCAMAYWAKAIGLYRPLEYRPPEADM